jgi:hypothetical protein
MAKDRFSNQKKSNYSKEFRWGNSEYTAPVKKYQDYSKQYGVVMDIRIYATVGILNVFYLKEFFEEIKKLGVKLVLNMVHYPHHYAITILPSKVKDAIRTKLELIEVENILHHTSPSIQNIINFMYGNSTNIPLLHTFFEKTTMHDEYRKESFKDTFPDFYELLKDYK